MSDSQSSSGSAEPHINPDGDSVNHDQAIFDAIVAATRIENDYGGQSSQAIIIDAKKFIEMFNNHRDRALCTSINGVAQTVPRETLAKTLYEFSIHENANLNLDLSPARPWADADQAYWLRAADAAELAQAETKPKWDNWPACSFPEMAAPAQRPADCDEIVNALRAIIVRCDEGDKKSDWLPIISSLAKSVLPKALALSSTKREAD